MDKQSKSQVDKFNDIFILMKYVIQILQTAT